ncbi:hypothetical protein ACWCQW_38525 [Streptomyces mirabilis]
MSPNSPTWIVSPRWFGEAVAGSTCHSPTSGGEFARLEEATEECFHTTFGADVIISGSIAPGFTALVRSCPPTAA